MTNTINFSKQARALFDDIATNELLPAGFTQYSPSVYIRVYPQEAITHVVYIKFDKYSRADSARFEIRSAVVLDDHPHTQLVKNRRHVYTAVHGGRFSQKVDPLLAHPRKGSYWPTLVVLDSESDVSELNADVRQVTKQHVKWLDRWYLKRKKWILRYMLYVRAGIQRSLAVKLSLGYYYAAQGNPTMVKRVERSLRENDAQFVGDRGMPDFYNPR